MRCNESKQAIPLLQRLHGASSSQSRATTAQIKPTETLICPDKVVVRAEAESNIRHPSRYFQCIRVIFSADPRSAALTSLSPFRLLAASSCPSFYLRRGVPAVGGRLRKASCQADGRGVTSAESRLRGDKVQARAPGPRAR